MTISNNESIWKNFVPIDYLNVNANEVNTDLPEGISISTMCASCKLNTPLNIDNIKTYLGLNQNDVLVVKKMNTEGIRSLINIKNKNTKRVKKNNDKTTQKDTSRNHFYNQITVVMRITHGEPKDINNVSKINMKLFKNGSVQMSGCKTIEGVNIALNKLIIRLKEIKAKMENGVITEKIFIENKNDITIKDFKIDMINSNYRVDMHIDRDKLFNLLLKKKIKSSYEPCIRACVIIKFAPLKDNPEQKEVSVFVFQKGNIIITGARSKSHIESAYNYINDILLSHKDEIIKKDEVFEEKLILDFYNDIINDINIDIT